MSGVSGHLPWGWFTALALIDAGLAYLALSRVLRGRRAPTQGTGKRAGEDQPLRLYGWWVAPSRAATLQGRGPAPQWRWTVHHEVLRRTVHPLRVPADELTPVV